MCTEFARQLSSEKKGYRDTSLIRNDPPPLGHPKNVGIGLLQGPRGRHFLMSEVSLYGARVARARACVCV